MFLNRGWSQIRSEKGMVRRGDRYGDVDIMRDGRLRDGG